jgi:hypothetical protein
MSNFKAAGLRDLSDRVIQTPVQIVSAQKTDPWYSSSTTWTEIPGLKVAITPYSSTSRILIILDIQLNTNGHGGIKLYKNGVPLGSGDPVGQNRNPVFGWDYGTSTYNTSGYPRRQKGGHWVDTPRTTSTIEYSIAYANPYSTSYYCGVNYNAYDNGDLTWNSTTVSAIHAIEIQQ